MLRSWLSVVVAALTACACNASDRSAARSGDAGPPGRPARTTPAIVFVKAPPDGDVAPIVHTALASAAAMGRRLVVYEGATWCEPCQRFHHAVESGEVGGDFPVDVTLLEFDADRDGERLAVAGYFGSYIPLFVLPAADGSGSEQKVEGGVKGETAARFVADHLRELLGH